MNEIEVAAGAAIAAQSATEVAYRRCQQDALHALQGSRHSTCHHANLRPIHEARDLMEKATRLLLEARDRQARMLGE